jgi:hypothetical protein
MNDPIRKVLETIAAIWEDWTVIEMKRVGLLRSDIIKQVHTSVDVRTGTVSLTIPSYHKYIEGGRRPGAKRPPIGVILKWVVRKLGPKDANRKAYAIANAIARRGIKPRPFMERAIRQTLDEAAEVTPLVLKVEIEPELRKILYK